MTEKKDKTRDQKAIKEPQGSTDIDQLCRWGVSFSMECIMSVKYGKWEPDAYTTTKDNAPFYRKECDALLDTFMTEASKLAAKNVDWNKIDYLSVAQLQCANGVGARFMIPPSQLCPFDRIFASLLGCVRSIWVTPVQYVVYTWLTQRIDSRSWDSYRMKPSVDDPPIRFEGRVLELHHYDSDSAF